MTTLYDLQPGDKVARTGLNRWHRSDIEIVSVERVTATLIILDGGDKHLKRDGRITPRRSGMYSPDPRIEVATPELEHRARSQALRALTQRAAQLIVDAIRNERDPDPVSLAEPAADLQSLVTEWTALGKEHP